MDFLLHHLLRRSTERFADHSALVSGSVRLTYEQAWQVAGQLSGALSDLGLSKSDRIGILLPPGTEQALAIIGCSRAGGVAVPMHDSLFARQVAHVIRDCQIKCVVTRQRAWSALRELLTDLPSLRHVILTDGERERGVPAVHAWHELLAGDLRPASEQAIEKDLAAILYTSGSTGRPKGVMLTHANLMSGASIVSDYLSITHSDRLLAVLPFSFDAGLNQLTTALQQGGTVVILSFVLAKQVVTVLQNERITGLAGVPTFWNLLTQNSFFQKARLPDLRYVTNTGGALPQPTLLRMRQVLSSTRIFLMYGLTEAFRSTYLPPGELERRPTSIGKAIPDTEIMVVSAAGELCAPGEVGELVHHGPTVSLGYWGQPELTSRILRPHPLAPSGVSQPPLVCYSGDMVYADDDGYLYFVGRRDNQIKTSGFRVSPGEVEEVLYEAPSVAQAAVVGIPDSLLGEQIVAWVVLVPDRPTTGDQLRQFCAERLPPYMVPKRIELREVLPATSSGKIDYAAIRRESADQVAAEPDALPPDA